MLPDRRFQHLPSDPRLGVRLKVLFLDIDGVLNSAASATFWHSHRDQSKWEMYASWTGTLKEYLAQEFDPMAISNLEELVRRVPEVQIVVSSTWRIGETAESLKKIFQPFELISSRIVGCTPIFRENRHRGNEIQHWLDQHPDTLSYVILDDDSDMLESQFPYFVDTDYRNGFTFLDMLKAEKILKGGGNQNSQLLSNPPPDQL